MRIKKPLALLLALALLLCGCGAPGAAAPPQLERSVSSASASVVSAKTGGYVAPPFEGAVFNEAAAEGAANARLDLSSVEKGYVAVSAVSDKRLKF